MSEALQPLGPPPPSAAPEPADVLSFPLPPTSGPYVAPPTSPPVPEAAPPTPATSPPPAATPTPPPAPPADELSELRAKVAEQAHVIELAKTRVETLVAEKREAFERERALQERIASLEAQLAAPAAAVPADPIADLLARVAALEAAVEPLRLA